MVQVNLVAWQVGLRKVSLSRLIQDSTALSLTQAKTCVDQLLAGATVSIALPTADAAEQFRREAGELGAVCVIEK